MKRHLEKIKKKPELERKKIARNLALIATGIVVVVWLVLLSLISSSRESEPSPLQGSAFETFSGLIDQGLEDFGGIEEGFNEQVEIEMTEKQNEVINEINEE
ncbi:MAG: hypothetical protein ACJAV6_000353 [Candidatus Paceibacteria bacterium]|jgi:hypothetical protein